MTKYTTKKTLFSLFLPLVSVNFFANAQQQPQSESLQTQRPTIAVKPIPLPWKNLNFEPINYNKYSLNGGVSLYTIPSVQTAKLRLDVIFPASIYSAAQDDITTFNALLEILLTGGFGGRSYDDLQQEMALNGIDLTTSLTADGKLKLTAMSLSQDSNLLLHYIADILLAPRFDPQSLQLWKENALSQFRELMNGNSFSAQNSFINIEANRVIFGPDHMFSKSLYYSSPKMINSVSLSQVKDLYHKICQKKGLQVWLTGNFSQDNTNELKKITEKIPSQPVEVKHWLPSRNLNAKFNAPIPLVIIRKSDMTQSNISLRYYTSEFGKLNSIEETQMKVLMDIFSSSGGVVGTDRFSKVMRAESGLSYAPHAYFRENIAWPNTNVSQFNLDFQSPNDKIFQAVVLAKSTWKHFLEKGVTKEEMESQRTAMMNRILGLELTVFDFANEILRQVTMDRMPSPLPLEESLHKLDDIRNLDELNRFLGYVETKRYSPVMVIMGNPSPEQVKKLQKKAGISYVKEISFSSLVNYYQ